MQALHIGGPTMTPAIEAAVRKHTSALPELRDLRCVCTWESGGGEEWHLPPRRNT